MTLMAGAGVSRGEELVESSSRIKAAFLRNFAHYVVWPDTAFSSKSAPWRIGILGPDPFRKALNETLEGRTEQGRSFEIIRADTLDKLPPCQIVYIGYRDKLRRTTALDQLKSQPVLTVGDAPDFLVEGGIVQFQVGDRVQMGINLDQARAVSLKIPTKILEVSRTVLEKGIVRGL